MGEGYNGFDDENVNSASNPDMSGLNTDTFGTVSTNDFIPGGSDFTSASTTTEEFVIGGGSSDEFIPGGSATNTTDAFVPGGSATTYNNDYSVPSGNNTYNSTYTTPAQKQGTGALEICALVFGILSLCGCCWGLFGIIGLILSIVALAKGRKSGLSIGGLVCSIIGIIVAIISIVFMSTSAGEDMMDGMFGDSTGSSYETEYDYDYEDEDDASVSDSNNETASKDDKADKNDTATSSTASGDISAASLSKVVVDGKTITLPCKFGDIKDLFDYNEDDIAELEEDGFGVSACTYVSIVQGGSDSDVAFWVENLSGSAVNSLDEMDVTSVWVTDFENPISFEVAGGIRFGMSATEVESIIAGTEYEREAGYSEGDYEYTVYVGDNWEYVICVDSEYGVDDIDVSYYE